MGKGECFGKELSLRHDGHMGRDHHVAGMYRGAGRCVHTIASVHRFNLYHTALFMQCRSAGYCTCETMQVLRGVELRLVVEAEPLPSIYRRGNISSQSGGEPQSSRSLRLALQGFHIMGGRGVDVGRGVLERTVNAVALDN